MKKKNGLSDKLVAEWHPSLNYALLPDDFSAGSGRKIWWLGSCGHEWEAIILNRSKGYGCPVCAGKIILKGFNDLATTHPEIAKEWHTVKNEIKVTEVTFGTRKKVWWLGSCGHEWETPIANRTSEKLATSCPYCANKAALAGFNDLATTHPEIASEWNFTKNSKKPTEITAGVTQQVWWICPKAHEYKAQVANRKNGNNCPYCSNNKAFKGFNDLSVTHPDLVKFWSPNNKLSYYEVLAGSQKKRLWVCENNHEYEATVKMMNDYPCPHCFGRKLTTGRNDLETLFPKIFQEFHPSLNDGIDPSRLTIGSNKKVWWLGSCGHEWDHSVVARTSKNFGCPFCSNSRVLKGFNDLATTHPEIASEWHFAKNENLLPNQITAGSDKRIWWMCNKGHEWKTYTYLRKSNHGCPTCYASKTVSDAEQEIYDFLVSLGEKVIQSDRKVLGGKEIDLYLPEKKIGIEFNGVYWHSEKFVDKDYHYDKWKLAKEKGIQLLQIWEDDWNRNKDLILKSIAYKIDAIDEFKNLLGQKSLSVFARSTQIVLLDVSIVKDFLNENHIQGFASGSYYLGLNDKNDELCAVMVLKEKIGNKLEIVRYATSEKVVGGFTKLLKYAIKSYNPKEFFTFADNTISDGKLYESNGFIVSGTLNPDYKYLVNGERKHKFGYRLKRFKNDDSLKYIEGMTETELSILNSILRVWDAGKIRYSLYFE